MLTVSRVVLVVSFGLGLGFGADEVTGQASALESRGDALAARQLLQRAVQNSPQDPSVLIQYAGFLDRYGDPDARRVYEQALPLLSGDQRLAAVRRLVLLDSLAGNRDVLATHLEQFHAAGGQGWQLAPPVEARGTRLAKAGVIRIPGPFRPFARMTAIAPDIEKDDVLGAVARNVVTNGYQASSSTESLEPTEYLKLVTKYLSQARELQKLAGEGKKIRIETCGSPQTGELLRILGYRMRGGCGSEIVLETVNASRAFLTVDSGFPIAPLEQALRTNKPFVYDFAPAEIPVLYGAEYWLFTRERPASEFIDAFLADPSLCRLYLGLSRLDTETAAALRERVPAQKIKAYAHVLDFFGSMFQIRNGKAIVPGGARSAPVWAEIAGVPPEQGAAFFERLISKDDGWAASYFDALARIDGPVKDYLTDPARLKRFYLAIRGKTTSPGPARPVFRSNTELMLFTARLRLDPDGKAHIPGGLEVWRNLFVHHPRGKFDAKLTKPANNWQQPDDAIEALFGLCRRAVDNEPLKIFMALTDLDRRRQQPLAPATVERLAHDYKVYNAQYPILNESGSLSDKTIVQFLDAAQTINKISDMPLRADTAGILQSLVGLWQIFCRQGSIADADADATLAEILAQFPSVRHGRDLFDAGQRGVMVLLKSSQSPASVSPQDRMFDLLAGGAKGSGSEAFSQIGQQMIRIFEAQRLISLNTIMDLASNLESVSRGEKLNTSLVNRLVSRIAEIQLPRASLSGPEANSFAFGYWTERHIDAQRKLNLKSAIEKASADPEKLRDLRGSLAPILRDTLVGFNYIAYAPPGAQILLANPLFVRTHDFLGIQGATQTWRVTEAYGSGWPSNAGGRLVGSLAGLPYALAETEQNFMVPSREQALIWSDLAPQIILTATVPRWWDVTPAQIHWVGLHMRYGKSLLAESALDAGRRREVLDILDRQLAPLRLERVGVLLEEGDARGAVESITPSELFFTAAQMLRQEKSAVDPLAAEIKRLAGEAPTQLNYQVISRAFGTPKPTLTNSYRPELLYLRTFPALMGYSSRIMAESWESGSLYWAALADEMHLAPSQLNVLIPEWTQQTLERIFATHLEDWPALLRSLRGVGDDVRTRAKRQQAGDQKASLE